jgi:hypothetical protein
LKYSNLFSFGKKQFLLSGLLAAASDVVNVFVIFVKNNIFYKITMSYFKNYETCMRSLLEVPGDKYVAFVTISGKVPLGEASNCGQEIETRNGTTIVHHVTITPCEYQLESA